MTSRLAVALVALGLWSGALVARLVQLQVVEHAAYAQRAAVQQLEEVPVVPPRGTIYDARGREMAVSLAVESAYADPGEPGYPGEEELARRVREVLPDLEVSGERLAASISPGGRFVWVARQLAPEDSRALQAAAIPGLHFREERRRYYPMGELAAHVLGFVGVDHQGLDGVERRFDDFLAGEAVVREVVLDGSGRRTVPPTARWPEAVPGSDLRLTLDATIQHLAERELAAAVERHRARGGSVVVLDPESGAVLALANRPTFDPNDFRAVDPERRRNLAVTGAYEPGSTFKMLVAAAALEAGIAPDVLIDCGMGSIVLAGVRIRDHKPFGELTFAEVMERSSNVGAIHLGRRIGRERLQETMVDFGIGRPTGIELAGESAGLVVPVGRWRPELTAAYASFGQGLAVTPLQLASAFAAVANGGTLLRPRVVARIDHPEAARPGGPEVLGHPVGPRTARELTHLLEGVVAHGTGSRAAIPGYRVAGKTGTGQKALPGRGYSDTRVVANFVGFAPAGRPALVILVAIDEPRGEIHGGLVAAPVFRRIAAEALVYLGVPPDPDVPPADGVVSEPPLHPLPAPDGAASVAGRAVPAPGRSGEAAEAGRS